MMRQLYLLMFLFCFVESNAQIDYRDDFQNKSLNSDYVNDSEILDDVVSYDFSRIINFGPFNDDLSIIGFIGADYQRIQIHFISVIKNPDNPIQYLVYGKSKVNDNICDFQGTIEIYKARFYNESEIDSIKQGFILAKYDFYEDPSQTHVGIFRGIVKTDWYIGDSGILQYNDIHLGADGYCNNQFVGIWRGYNRTDFKTCNWGVLRIPYSGNLDSGAGEFSPDKKYHDSGWSDYLKELNDFINDRTQIEWWNE